MCTCTHTCMHTYTHTHIHTCTCTHTHTHTHSQWRDWCYFQLHRIMLYTIGKYWNFVQQLKICAYYPVNAMATNLAPMTAISSPWQSRPLTATENHTTSTRLGKNWVRKTSYWQVFVLPVLWSSNFYNIQNSEAFHFFLKPGPPPPWGYFSHLWL